MSAACQLCRSLERRIERSTLSKVGEAAEGAEGAARGVTRGGRSSISAKLARVHPTPKAVNATADGYHEPMHWKRGSRTIAGSLPPLHPKASEHACRQAACQHADPLVRLRSLRRQCFAFNVDISISEGAEELEAKLAFGSREPSYSVALREDSQERRVARSRFY